MTKWEQQLIPGQTRDCIHGSLARSCQVCDLERDVFELKQSLDWLFANCRIVHWSNTHDYPIEHNPFAQKDSRALIEAEMK